MAGLLLPARWSLAPIAFMLHIYAAVAEEEARKISQRQTAVNLLPVIDPIRATNARSLAEIAEALTSR